MVKTTTSVALALVLFSASAFAANEQGSSSEQGSSNGAPFKALTELIEANDARITENASLIAANSSVIASNASSIADLQAEAAQTSDALSALESRISTNETDIASAFAAISEANGNIDALTVNINDLTISVSSSINLLTTEINTLKSTVATLSTSLDTLSDDMTNAVTDLDNAIASNSDDIAVLSAVVTSMDAKMTMACAKILSLESRIDSAEASIDSQADSLSAIDAKIVALDVIVTDLNSSLTNDAITNSDVYFLYLAHPALNISNSSNKLNLYKAKYENGEISSIEIVRTIGTFISEPSLYTIYHDSADKPVYGHNVNDYYSGTEYDGLTERYIFLSHSLTELSDKINNNAQNNDCIRNAANASGGFNSRNNFWTYFCPTETLSTNILAQ